MPGPAIESTHATLTERDRDIFSLLVPQIIINMASDFVVIRKGIKGPTSARSRPSDGKAHATGEAARTIIEGAADAAIAGGNRSHGVTARGRRLQCNARTLDAKRCAGKSLASVLTSSRWLRDCGKARAC